MYGESKSFMENLEKTMNGLKKIENKINVILMDLFGEFHWK